MSRVCLQMATHKRKRSRAGGGASAGEGDEAARGLFECLCSNVAAVGTPCVLFHTFSTMDARACVFVCAALGLCRSADGSAFTHESAEGLAAALTERATATEGLNQINAALRAVISMPAACAPLRSPDGV